MSKSRSHTREKRTSRAEVDSIVKVKALSREKNNGMWETGNSNTSNISHRVSLTMASSVH